MTKKYIAVVPTTAHGSGLACVRSLGQQGINVIAVGNENKLPEFKSKYCNESVLTPPPEEDFQNYKEVLLDLAQRNDVVTVVPLAESDIYCLAKHYQEFSNHLQPVWINKDTLEKVQDRVKLIKLAKGLDVSVPNTTLLADWKAAESPAVVKSRYSILEDSNKTFYPGHFFVEKGEKLDKNRVKELMSHEPIVQKFIPGKEVGYFALAHRGDIVVDFQHKRIRSQSFKDGASVFREAINDVSVKERGKAILKELEWTGPAMVEFRRTESGELYLLEVNPRFWGSLPLAVHSGVDFPFEYYRMAQGDKLSKKFTYEVGTQSQRLFGEFIYLMSIISESKPNFIERPPLVHEFINILFSAPTSHFDYLSLHDPKPFFYNLYNYINPHTKL
jgi:predicted ATP-grasp superfamily ATP-dependent carboligase